MDKEKLGERPERRKECILSPVSGKVIPKAEIIDPVFAGEYFGRGVCIQPESDKILSPVNGRVETVANDGHSVTVVSKTGLKVWIYIGVDVVNLKGKYIWTLKKAGEEVQEGKPLLVCDFEAMRELGYETNVNVVIVQPQNALGIIITPDNKVNEKDKILYILYDHEYA